MPNFTFVAQPFHALSFVHPEIERFNGCLDRGRLQIIRILIPKLQEVSWDYQPMPESPFGCVEANAAADMAEDVAECAADNDELKRKEALEVPPGPVPPPVPRIRADDVTLIELGSLGAFVAVGAMDTGWGALDTWPLGSHTGELGQGGRRLDAAQ